MNFLINTLFKFKILKFEFFLIILFLFISGCTNSGLNQYYGNSNLVLSKETTKRFVQYLQGDFYSMSENKRAYFVSPLYFYVTEDGNNSFIFYCKSLNSYDCNPVVETYQSIIHCSELFNKPCKIFAREEFVLWNDKKLRVASKQKSDIILLLENNNFIKKGSSKEIQLDFNKSEKYSDTYIFERQFISPTD